MEDLFINIPRVYTGLAEWLFSLIFIIHASKRVKGLKLYMAIFLWLGIFVSYQLLAGILPLFLWIPGMIGAVLLIYAFIYSLARMRTKTAIYFTAFAFISAEFAASFEWQLYYFFLVNEMFTSVLFEGILLITVYGLIFLFMYVLEQRYKTRSAIQDLRNNELITIIVISVLVFAIGNLNFIDINTPFTGRFAAEIFYIRTLVLFSGVVLLYTQREHRLVTHSKIELAAVQSVLEKQYEQYRINQELNDVVNRRYHDLKHQIQLIRNEHNIDKKNQYLNALEQDIKEFELHYHTGNDVLDTVLSSKAQTIIKNDINFTCVAEGKALDFMSLLDLVSLFGNALDNAIESVVQIEDKDKRVIKLTIHKKETFLLVRLENYYETSLKKTDQGFLTTKKDKLTHGYGLKSIKAVVDKYQGELSIDTNNNWFKLFILIPLS
ncbi:MAG: GHKL domain-containing protein [Bacillota bacterium]